MTPNNAASIHQRLLNRAKSEHRPFIELLQVYSIERFLYRLGKSAYCDQFVLKGAIVFLAWKVPLTRPTRDIDLLGFTDNSIGNLVRIIQEVCTHPVEVDGLVFDADTVQGSVIKEEADYQGVRITFSGFLGKAQIPMRLDIGFADVVTPSPKEVELPTILDNLDKPCLRIYPPETVVAEKFQAMVVLGAINSRMKDFYDLWYMANSMEFEYRELYPAVVNTFDRRGTRLPHEKPTALSDDFANLKQGLWTAFLKKNQILDAPKIMIDVIQELQTFFDPIINLDQISPNRWLPQRGWVESEE